MEIQKRDLVIDYQVDRKSVAHLATKYGLQSREMVTVLRAADITVRKNEIKAEDEVEYPEVYIVDEQSRKEVDFSPRKRKTKS